MNNAAMTVDSTGTSAPAETSAVTAAEPSAFMITTVQSPSSRRHVSSGSVPVVSATQKSCSVGGVAGAAPGVDR